MLELGYSQSLNPVAESVQLSFKKIQQSYFNELLSNLP